MKPAPEHYDPPLELLAIREHLEDAGIPTIFDKGETYGDTERKVYLDVAGYIQVYMDGPNVAFTYFDVPSWDRSNKFSNPQAELDSAIADTGFGLGRNSFAPHIHITNIDLNPPGSLEDLTLSFKILLAAHESWEIKQRKTSP